MNVVINGAAAELADGSTLADAVQTVTGLPSGVATAVNGTVVTRAAWAATALADGDRVEVLTAVQGG